MSKKDTLTTAAGIPVPDNQNSRRLYAGGEFVPFDERGSEETIDSEHRRRHEDGAQGDSRAPGRSFLQGRSGVRQGRSRRVRLAGNQRCLGRRRTDTVEVSWKPFAIWRTRR